MPWYVQRDHSGKICGISRQPQVQRDGHCLTEADPLPDNNEEVLAFQKRNEELSPLPAWDKIDFEEMHRQHEINQKEARELERLMLRHFQEMAELELALGALLQVILRVPPPGNNVARAVYFSIPGFDQRTTTVGKALVQFVEDYMSADRAQYGEMEFLIAAWGNVATGLHEVRKIRNVIAHGSISLIPHAGKHNARLTAPVFDPIKVGNLLMKGSNPGLGASDMKEALKLMRCVADCVDRINEGITALHNFGLPALLETRARLERNLLALKSLA
ncbi:MAG TPA: hypothetical protein VE085_13640 [Burkholderiales bacterium]|nr:hypothetical protein [Burkholderiales bacterium]